MVRFEPKISAVGGHCSNNCAALLKKMNHLKESVTILLTSFQFILVFCIRPPRLNGEKLPTARQLTVAARLWLSALKPGHDFPDPGQPKFFDFFWRFFRILLQKFFQVLVRLVLEVF